MTRRPLRFLQLYSRDMNIYGDWGNVLCLERRAQWHGYDVELIEYNPEDPFPTDVDLIVGGGGQDSGQVRIKEDLRENAATLRKLADDGVPMLMICGLYQLFGKFFRTKDGETIEGIGLFDSETQAGDHRLTGNIVIQSEQFGEIVGYENHSGRTTLGPTARPLGFVTKGAGNNGRDKTEGVIYNHCVGTYLHGSLLPKNPAIADWLIEHACMRAYGDFTPTVIDDRFAEMAREIAAKRPR